MSYTNNIHDLDMKWFPQEYHNLLRLIEFWDVSRNRSQRNPNDTYIHQKEKIKSFMVSLWQLTTQIITIHSQWMTCSSHKRGGAHTAAAMSDTSSSARHTTSGVLDKRHSNTLKIQTIIRNMDVNFSMFQLFNWPLRSPRNSLAEQILKKQPKFIPS